MTEEIRKQKALLRQQLSELIQEEKALKLKEIEELPLQLEGEEKEFKISGWPYEGTAQVTKPFGTFRRQYTTKKGKKAFRRVNVEPESYKKGVMYPDVYSRGPNKGNVHKMAGKRKPYNYDAPERRLFQELDDFNARILYYAYATTLSVKEIALVTGSDKRYINKVLKTYQPIFPVKSIFRYKQYLKKTGEIPLEGQSMDMLQRIIAEIEPESQDFENYDKLLRAPVIVRDDFMNVASKPKMTKVKTKKKFDKKTEKEYIFNPPKKKKTAYMLFREAVKQATGKLPQKGLWQQYKNKLSNEEAIQMKNTGNLPADINTVLNR